MSQKYNKSEITGKLSESNIVQKSQPLQTLWKSKFGLGELKVLDTYLSRIDSHNPEQRKVLFTKSEFEDLLGIERMRPRVLEKYTDALMDRKILLEDERYAGGYHKIVLFCESGCYCDPATGKWMVEMSCSPEAMEYVFNIEEIGYLRYRLKNVLQLTSRYSYFMFLYLSKNLFRGTWDVPIEELRTVLGCNEEAIYDQFKYFNQRILKKCAEEINARTELSYTYQPIRCGKSVTEIRFSIQKQPAQLIEDIKKRP